MTQKQHPIGTGFTAASTADDVLEGVGLSGTKVIVTGGHSGLGLETTRALSKAGASVTVGARSARSLLSDPDLIGMPPTTVPLTTTDLASRR